jgi:3-oxoacyl-[acyl-carrier-protein] synthase II
MMQEGLVAPTLNLDEVDPRCGMLRHVREAERATIRTAAVQNFAFGGVNTCLLLRQLEG